MMIWIANSSARSGSPQLFRAKRGYNHILWLCHTYDVDQRRRSNFKSNKVRPLPTHCTLLIAHSALRTLKYIAIVCGMTQNIYIPGARVVSGKSTRALRALGLRALNRIQPSHPVYN